MATSPFSQLPSVLSRRRTELVSLVGKVARGAATAASNELTADTPVKRGVARSNWVATLDQPFEGLLPAYHPILDLTSGPAPPSRKFETENLASARAQNQAAFRAFDPERNSTIFLRNNAGHIGLLNAGHSGQTEAGFFERGVLSALKSILGVWKLAP